MYSEQKKHTNRACREAWMPLLGLLLLGFALFIFIRDMYFRSSGESGPFVPTMVAVLIAFCGGGLIRRYARRRNEEDNELKN